MSPEGQRAVLKNHRDELTEDGAVKKIRKLYPPAKFPDFYRHAKKSESVLKNAKQQARRNLHANSASITKAEKKKLMGSLEMKEIQLAELNVPVVTGQETEESQ